MRTIHQKHHVAAPPEEVYRALTNPFTIELWTGYPAEMSLEPGSEFSLFEGDITGRNLEFISNQLIRQQWYFDGEEKDSFVRLNLIPEKNNTVIELIHENVPDKIFEEMSSGWKNIYFKALKLFFK